MTSSRSESEVAPFTPAAGVHWLTPFYDLGVAVLTRESHWRNRLVAQVRPSPDDVIADLGCGTGSLLVKLGMAARGVKLVGIDPDPTVLDRARAKTRRAGVEVDLVQGFARDASSLLRGRAVTKIVSSLVFHQVPLSEKSAALGAAYEALPSGGELHIADYGLQRTKLMRRLFRATVQNLDGMENTEPQARGVLPELIRSAGFSEVVEVEVVPTSTGSISLIRALRL